MLFSSETLFDHLFFTCETKKKSSQCYCKPIIKIVTDVDKLSWQASDEINLLLHFGFAVALYSLLEQRFTQEQIERYIKLYYIYAKH